MIELEWVFKGIYGLIGPLNSRRWGLCYVPSGVGARGIAECFLTLALHFSLEAGRIGCKNLVKLP